MRSDIAEKFDDVISQGAAIIRNNDRMIEMLIERAKPCWIMGHKAVAVNCTMLINEVADKLKDKADVVIIYGDNNKDGTFVSLRSREVDVSRIAEHFGGGGHEHSSSFTEEFHTPHVWEMYNEGPMACQNSPSPSS
jgi:c-di-AMP phosphodiesterase-like protein